MSNSTRGPRVAHWLALSLMGALLLALGVFLTMRARSGGSAGSALIRIDSNGTTRLGPVPLRNTNLRDAAFTAVSHLNKGTVTVAASGSARMSDFVKTVDAMQRAGITSLTFRADSAAESAKVSDLVKTGYVMGRAASTSSTEQARSGASLTVTNK